MSDDPDPERVQERATERQHERAEHTENVLAQVDALVTRTDYPTTSEELATEYADDEIELANETESLGSVFDRLVDERFESPEAAREAAYNELTGEAGPDAEYNDERDFQRLADDASRESSDGGGSDV